MIASGGGMSGELPPLRPSPSLDASADPSGVLPNQQLMREKQQITIITNFVLYHWLGGMGYHRYHVRDITIQARSTKD